MVTAALVSFAILLVAWIAAPDAGVVATTDGAPAGSDAPEAQPVAA